MNAKTAEQLIQCHSGPERECADPGIRKALVYAAKHEILKDKLSAQKELDERAQASISAISLPADLEGKFRDFDNPPARPPGGFTRALKQPPVLAVGIALLVMLGWFIYSALVRSDDFQGKDNVMQILDLDQSSEASRPGFAVETTEAGMMGDLLFSQYGFENYYIPGELSHLKTVGCRVFKQDGFSVAQIAIEQHQSFLFVFHAGDFGVKVSHPDHWRVFDADDWSVGILAHGDECVMLAFHGKKAEMKRFLAGEG